MRVNTVARMCQVLSGLCTPGTRRILPNMFVWKASGRFCSAKVRWMLSSPYRHLNLEQLMTASPTRKRHFANVHACPPKVCSCLMVAWTAPIFMKSVWLSTESVRAVLPNKYLVCLWLLRNWCTIYEFGGWLVPMRVRLMHVAKFSFTFYIPVLVVLTAKNLLMVCVWVPNNSASFAYKTSEKCTWTCTFNCLLLLWSVQISFNIILNTAVWNCMGCCARHILPVCFSKKTGQTRQLLPTLNLVL